MLAQLVCLDRRYQRMNCYNVREVQTLLQSKYSPTKQTEAELRDAMIDVVLELRYRSNLNRVDYSMYVFYKNAILNSS